MFHFGQCFFRSIVALRLFQLLLLILFYLHTSRALFLPDATTIDFKSRLRWPRGKSYNHYESFCGLSAFSSFFDNNQSELKLI